jgi:pseudouridine synthase
VRDLLKGLKARVFPVGRLDFNAEGLLLLTNDGDVANRMMHPRYGVKRIYLVKVKGIPSEQVLKEARKGIVLQDGVRVTPSLSIHRRLRSNAWIKVEIAEGRHHEVRQIFDHLGMRVLRLKRVAYGPLELGALRPGESRPLTPAEVDRLRESLGLSR